jgi:hypothetical protein
MPIGKLTLKGLSRLGGGLGSVKPGKPPPPAIVVGDLVLTDAFGAENGFILTENLDTISVTEPDPNY